MRVPRRSWLRLLGVGRFRRRVIVGWLLGVGIELFVVGGGPRWNGAVVKDVSQGLLLWSPRDSKGVLGWAWAARIRSTDRNEKAPKRAARSNASSGPPCGRFPRASIPAGPGPCPCDGFSTSLPESDWPPVPIRQIARMRLPLLRVLLGTVLGQFAMLARNVPRQEWMSSKHRQVRVVDDQFLFSDPHGQHLPRQRHGTE